MAILEGRPDVAPAGQEHTEAVAQPTALAEILQQIKAMREELSQLAVRESELRAVLELATELDPQMDRLLKIVSSKSAMESSVSAAIDQAELRLDPCPYSVIDDLLPTEFYHALLKGIPPVDLFRNKPPGKTHLDVPFSLAPCYSQKVWSYMALKLVTKVIGPRLIEKFRPHTDNWIALNWPGLAPESVTMHGSGGRIMYRRRGYRILPHRDPKWAFITCILYLARPGDSDTWGTQLYSVDGDTEATSAAPFWIDEKRCHLVEDVAFRPNRLLVFLNSTGAHGAHIPTDAQPETLERYIYQFRVAPTTHAVAKLKSLLTEEQRPLWAGKAMLDY